MMDGVVTWQLVSQAVIRHSTAGSANRIAEMKVLQRTDDEIEVWLDQDIGEAFLVRYTWSKADRRRLSLMENDMHSPRDALALAATIAADGDAPDVQAQVFGFTETVTIR